MPQPQWYPNNLKGYRIRSGHERKQRVPTRLRDLDDWMDTGALEYRSYGRRYIQPQPINERWYRDWRKYESDGNSRQLFQTRRAKRPPSLLQRHGGYKQYHKTIKNLQRYEKDLFYAEDIAMLARQRWPQDHYNQRNEAPSRVSRKRKA